MVVVVVGGGGVWWWCVVVVCGGGGVYVYKYIGRGEGGLHNLLVYPHITGENWVVGVYVECQKIQNPHDGCCQVFSFTFLVPMI